MAAASSSRARLPLEDFIQLLDNEEVSGQTSINMKLANQEVPFETLSTRRSFCAKDSYKVDMKLMNMRQGGLVGLQSGYYGYLTYGDYSEKDTILMNSIGVSKHENSYEVEIESNPKQTSALESKKKESHEIDMESDSKENSHMKVDKKGLHGTVRTKYKTGADSHVTQNVSEIPYYEVIKKKNKDHKAAMMSSMLRQSGLCGTMGGNLGILVYGSFGSGEDIAF